MLSVEAEGLERSWQHLEALGSRLERKRKTNHDSRRIFCQLLSALHRMVSPILLPSRTRYIFQPVSHSPTTARPALPMRPHASMCPTKTDDM